MIVAQALEENLTILTADSDIPKYSAPVIWK
jgi:PIN domain nuclease of toxin-antitoxin system